MRFDKPGMLRERARRREAVTYSTKLAIEGMT